MGCAQSRIDNEESVSRCKERRNLMKEAMVARNAFASGHSGYAVSLKNAGAALSDYGHGETQVTQEMEILHSQHLPMDPASEPPPHLENLNLPPPPPPLPTFTPSPIKRAISMPAMSAEALKMGARRVGLAIAEENEEEEEDHEHSEDESHKGFQRRSRNGASETTPSPLRTSEMKAVPPMPDSKGMAWDYFFMVDNMPGPSLSENEEAEEFGEDENMGIGGGGGDDGVEPKTPEKVEEIEEKPEEEAPVKVAIEHSKTAPPEFSRRVANVIPGVTLMDILNKIDDHFLKASESAQEVSKMLEATRLHYHSNFADNRGHIDHSARVMRVITWNRSFRGIPNGDGKDENSDDYYETHATVLDKMLAWEKKLYDEVKQGELMKVEYQRKVALLNKQKKRSASAETLEKTKAAVSHLHTRYIVDMQSMDSTVSEVNQLRDEQLYPKLVSLADGMANMWENMCTHHDSQLKIVTDLKSLDIGHTPMETTKHHHARTVQLWNVLVRDFSSKMANMWENMCTHHDSQLKIVTDLKSLDIGHTPMETTKHHHARTVQLWNVLQEWHSHFENLVTHQKQYIQALNSWLKLNLIPIESSLKEKISSPPRVQHPPIQALLHSWHDFLEKLPDELAKSAILSFSAVIKTIMLHQEEEMKLKEKFEETRKEYLRKNQAFEDWYQKYSQRHAEMDEERGEDAVPKDPVSEKKFIVDSLKKRLEEECEAHQSHCIQVKEKSLGSLKTRLPEIFRSMTDYARACSEAYGKLRSIRETQV